MKFRLAAVAALVLAGLPAVLVTATPADASVPTCAGKRATIVGTAGSNVIHGTSHNDVIVGLGGNDVIHGGKGKDIICGGGGNDRIYTDGEQATVYGQGGDDTIVVSSTQKGLDEDKIIGGSGDDHITARPASVFYSSTYDVGVAGNSGDDVINVAGHAYIRGNSGNDRITLSDVDKAHLSTFSHVAGDSGNDTIVIHSAGSVDDAFGDDGNDTIEADAAGDFDLFGGAGNDTIAMLSSSTGVQTGERIIGGGGADRITARGGDDKIYGGDAPGVPGSGDTGTDLGDTITAGDGNDTIWPGDGNDTVVAGAGDDTVNASNGDDTISAGDGADTVDGGAGNDAISGGAGDDLIDAGDGNDIVSAGDGNDQVSGGAGGDMLTGDAGDDVIVGGTGDDQMYGDDGTDSCSGGSGTDSCDGGSPTPVDPTTDPDICANDVENPTDCKVQGFPATWTGTIDETDHEVNFLLDGVWQTDLTYELHGAITYTKINDTGTEAAYFDQGSIDVTVTGTQDGCAVSGSGTVPVGQGNDPNFGVSLNSINIWIDQTPNVYSIAAHSGTTLPVTTTASDTCSGDPTTVAVPAVESDIRNYGSDRPAYTPNTTTLVGSWSWSDPSTPTTVSSSWSFTAGG